MRLQNITAKAHPSGNRIDLEWVNPNPDEYPGVRVMRREGTHPTSPTDGVLVQEEIGLTSASDQNLKGETVYYYTLFPFKGDPREYKFEPHNRISAMATAPYNLAGQMMELLPAIYHRYDTVLPRDVPPGMREEDKQRGQLRRFLDLPGSHLDQFYSLAKAMLNLYNLDQVDGRLLPLLAQWIGWDTDFTLEVAGQRNELRNAPAWYKTTGVIPAAEATIKRISGWESRTKEFVHNVFLSNQPERLNLWERQRDSSGEWFQPTAPLSLNFAYEGRPTAVRDGDGNLWLFYHTLRNGRWNIWYKTLFAVGLEFKDDLDSSIISTGLQQAFKDQGLSLSQNATIEKKDSEWLIIDSDKREIYTIKEESGHLKVYRGSQPLTNRAGIDKYPAAAIQGTTLWVFWSTYDETDKKWRIDFCTYTGGVWSSIDVFKNPGEAEPLPERKQPCAVTDNTGGLWLFWLERVGTRWQLRYNRHNGAAWGFVVSFPLDAGNDPRVEADPFVLFHPSDEDRPIWVFWARKEPTGWTIAYRFKKSLDPAASNWDTDIQTLPKIPPDADYHNREPAAFVSNGNLELFWSSNRDGSWSIWHSILNGTPEPEKVAASHYSQRDPLPLLVNGQTFLIYRSNASLSYTSKVYGATETVDFRYAGSTTMNVHNASKISLWRSFEDFQTYTYDTQKTNEDWYARDTIAAYLTPNTEDDQIIIRKRNIITDVLRRFLPIQVRPVFLIQQVHHELVYTYDYPGAKPQRLIGEQMIDTILSEVYLGLASSYLDRAGFRFLRTWQAGQPPTTQAKLNDLSFRLFLNGVSEGE